ncbi:MAG: periplasmic heavy metal sensor [Candidatus Aminicenantes bacterium]
MKVKVLTYAALILLIVNLTALGVIVYHRWFKPDISCPGEGFERLKQELSLSPEQEKLMLQTRGDFHNNIDALSQKLQEERRNLVASLKRETMDMDELKGIVKKINAYQLQAQEKVVEHLLEVKNILEPEQQDIFFSIVLERFEMSSEPREGRYLRIR